MRPNQRLQLTNREGLASLVFTMLRIARGSQLKRDSLGGSLDAPFGGP